MLFSLGNGRFYVVQSVSSDTVLVLSEPYLEATAPGAVYMLRPIGVADTANARYRVADHYAVAASRLIMGEGRNVWFSDTLDSTTGRPRIDLLDGTSAPVLLSRSITPLLQDHMAQGRQPGSGAVYRNHYLLPILDAAGAVTEMLVCRLDRAANTRLGTVFPWVRWTGYAGELAALATRVGAQGVSRQPILLRAHDHADESVGPDAVGPGRVGHDGGR
jgi:hypothetical protein